MNMKPEAVRLFVSVTVFISASGLCWTLLVLRGFRIDDGCVSLLENLIHKSILHLLLIF